MKNHLQLLLLIFVAYLVCMPCLGQTASEQAGIIQLSNTYREIAESIKEIETSLKTDQTPQPQKYKIYLSEIARKFHTLRDTGSVTPADKNARTRINTAAYEALLKDKEFGGYADTIDQLRKASLQTYPLPIPYIAQRIDPALVPHVRSQKKNRISEEEDAEETGTNTAGGKVFAMVLAGAAVLIALGLALYFRSAKAAAARKARKNQQFIAQRIIEESLAIIEEQHKIIKETYTRIDQESIVSEAERKIRQARQKIDEACAITGTTVKIPELPPPPPPPTNSYGIENYTCSEDLPSDTPPLQKPERVFPGSECSPERTFTLVIHHQGQSPRRFPLTKPVVSVGRKSTHTQQGPDICIDTEDKGISRVHAVLSYKSFPEENSYFWILAINQFSDKNPGLEHVRTAEMETGDGKRLRHIAFIMERKRKVHLSPSIYLCIE